MGRIAVSSVARSPRWRSIEGRMPRSMSVISRPRVTFLIFLTVLFVLSLLVLDSIFRPWHALIPLVATNGLPMLAPGCDLFTGSWVYDEAYPLYTNCSFAEQGFRCAENGRADLLYRNWRWQPRDCNMPRFNAQDMLTRLKNKRLAFVGDSMGRTQWESLVCLLMAGARDKALVKEIGGRVITKTAPYLAVRFPGFNVTVEYYRSRWLVRLGRPPRHSPKRAVATLKLDELESVSSQWQGADVLVFNTGHWWTSAKTYRSGCYFQVGSSIRLGMKMEEAYRKAVATWAAWVNEQLNPDVAQVFFRSFEPSHWYRKSCLNSTFPITNETHLQPLGQYMQSGVLDNVWDTLHVRATLLNITRLSSLRPDGHIFNYSRGGPPLDCAHWCLPGVPDIWNEQLYALLLLRASEKASANIMAILAALFQEYSQQCLLQLTSSATHLGAKLGENDRFCSEGFQLRSSPAAGGVHFERIRRLSQHIPFLQVAISSTILLPDTPCVSGTLGVLHVYSEAVVDLECQSVARIGPRFLRLWWRKKRTILCLHWFCKRPESLKSMSGCSEVYSLWPRSHQIPDVARFCWFFFIANHNVPLESCDFDVMVLQVKILAVEHGKHGEVVRNAPSPAPSQWNFIWRSLYES